MQGQSIVSETGQVDHIAAKKTEQIREYPKETKINNCKAEKVNRSPS